MVYYLVATLYVLACLLLLVVVLLQQGKGGDIASAFGGGSQTAFGARAGATVLTKATAILGTLFMIGALALGIMGRGGPGSLMRGVGAPQQQTPAPAAQPDPEKPQPTEKPQDQPK